MLYYMICVASYIYWLFESLDLEIVETKKVLDLAYHTAMLKNLLLDMVDEFTERWEERIGNLTKKHDAEVKHFLSPGESTYSAIAE